MALIDVINSMWRIERCSPKMPKKNNQLLTKKTQTFPNNAQDVLLKNVLPYIIFNTEIRYFIRIQNNMDTDITLIVSPGSTHVTEYIRRRRHQVNEYGVGQGGLVGHGTGFTPTEDSITLLEKQLMMGGSASSKLLVHKDSQGGQLQNIAEPVKVVLMDITVVGGGHGLPIATGGVRRGDLLVEQDPQGRPKLTISFTDLGDLPSLRMGHISHGLDSLKSILKAEEARKSIDNKSIRSKLKSTVGKEEETAYTITFGLDL